MKLANKLVAPIGKPIKTFRPFSFSKESEDAETAYQEVDFLVPLPATLHMLDEDNIDEKISIADNKERLHQLQKSIEQDARHLLSLHDKYLQSSCLLSRDKGSICLKNGDTELTITSGSSDTFGDYLAVCVQDRTTICKPESSDKEVYA